MGVEGSDRRRLAHGALALMLSASRPRRFAQAPAKQPPPPPPADTTTMVENPDAVPPPPQDTPPAEPVTPAPTEPNAPEQKSPEHVPRRCIRLPAVDARDEQSFAALHRPAPDLFDALSRPGVRERARLPQEELQLGAVGSDHRSCSRTFPITAMPRRWRRRATWSCSTSLRCRCRWRPSRRASAFSRSTITSLRMSPRSTSGTRAMHSGGGSWAASRRRSRSTRNRSSTIS